MTQQKGKQSGPQTHAQSKTIFPFTQNGPNKNQKLRKIWKHFPSTPCILLHLSLRRQKRRWRSVSVTEARRRMGTTIHGCPPLNTPSGGYPPSMAVQTQSPNDEKISQRSISLHPLHGSHSHCHGLPQRPLAPPMRRSENTAPDDAGHAPNAPQAGDTWPTRAALGLAALRYIIDQPAARLKEKTMSLMLVSEVAGGRWRWRWRLLRGCWLAIEGH